MRLSLHVLALIVMCLPANAAAPLIGRAIVHDGDTIRIGRQSIRIWGIDAVELAQHCGDVACGQLARDTLKTIIGAHDVTCIAKGRSYQRIVATCHVAGKDVAKEMARAGMAFDATRYSRGLYKNDELSARDAGLGLWSMQAEDPAHWRACHLHRRGKDKPADCVLE